MKKVLLVMLISVLFISMLILFNCSPFKFKQDKARDSFYMLDETDTVRSTTMCIAAFGDFGSSTSGSKKQADVAALVKSFNPDFIISTGDVNQGDSGNYDLECGALYSDFIGNYTGSYGQGSAVNRFFPAIGNHDNWTTSNYLTFFTLPGITGNTSGNERYYDYTEGAVHFFVINSNESTYADPDGRDKNSVQALWLKTQLALSAASWNIVYFHHPPYTSCSNHASDTVMQWPFEEWGADVVLSGHNHVYERILKDDNSDSIMMPYFTIGLGGYSTNSFGTVVSGSQFRYNSSYGALIIQASDTSLTFQFNSLSGGAVDTYTMIK